MNQVFFDDVVVPVANRVGPENEGWTVAKYLLEFERGGGGAAPGLGKLWSLRALASLTREDGTSVLSSRRWLLGWRRWRCVLMPSS